MLSEVSCKLREDFEAFADMANEFNNYEGHIYLRYWLKVVKPKVLSVISGCETHEHWNNAEAWSQRLLGDLEARVLPKFPKYSGCHLAVALLRERIEAASNFKLIQFLTADGVVDMLKLVAEKQAVEAKARRFRESGRLN